MTTSLYKQIPEGSYDIIGDVHGEILILIQLITSLGYDLSTLSHPTGRKLIFVGDLVDRGPDSMAVIRLVKSFIDAGIAYSVIGNHEINVANQEPKDGTGWILERQNKDDRYLPFSKVTSEEDKKFVFDFINSLPVAIESPSFRVVHAAWDLDAIDEIKQIDVISSYPEFFSSRKQSFRASLPVEELNAYLDEQDIYSEDLKDPSVELPILPGTANYYYKLQRYNPIRVLTSGVEEPIKEPMFAGGEWRFLGRHAWWDTYFEAKPVIVGHYWRKVNESTWSLSPDYLFSGISFNSWLGAKHSVFCVDFSIGARFMERNGNKPEFSMGRLAALRFPENEIMFENGETVACC